MIVISLGKDKPSIIGGIVVTSLQILCKSSIENTPWSNSKDFWKFFIRDLLILFLLSKYYSRRKSNSLSMSTNSPFSSINFDNFSIFY